jgi:FixJ family two-component response regulator
VLAPREIETVRWIAMGYTQAQIATRMGLSLATVNTYATRIRSKLLGNQQGRIDQGGDPARLSGRRRQSGRLTVIR